jgi:hypothetical protein
MVRRGFRRTQWSIVVVPSLSIHPLLGSAGFHQLRCYYEGIRLLRGRRPVVVASFGSTARADLRRSLWVRTLDVPPLPPPLPPRPRLDFVETRSPGRSGLHRGSLAFGAAVRLGLLLHTASRRQLRRLTTAVTACSCLQLAVATNSPRKGLSLQCPCQAHLRLWRRPPRSRCVEGAWA